MWLSPRFSTLIFRLYSPGGNWLSTLHVGVGSNGVFPWGSFIVQFLHRTITVGQEGAGSRLSVCLIRRTKLPHAWWGTDLKIISPFKLKGTRNGCQSLGRSLKNNCRFNLLSASDNAPAVACINCQVGTRGLATRWVVDHLIQALATAHILGGVKWQMDLFICQSSDSRIPREILVCWGADLFPGLMILQSSGCSDKYPLPQFCPAFQDPDRGHFGNPHCTEMDMVLVHTQISGSLSVSLPGGVRI